MLILKGGVILGYDLSILIYIIILSVVIFFLKEN